MALFLLLSVPSFLLFALLYTHKNAKRLDFDYITMFKGAIWFIPAFIVLSFLQNVFKVSYKPIEHYFYYFYKDHFLYTLFGVAGYFVFFGMSGVPRNKDGFLVPLTFLSGYFTLVSLDHFLIYIGDFDFYIAFVLPILRIATIIALSLLIERFADEVSNMKIVYGLIMAGVPILCATSSFAYMVNLGMLSFIVSIVILAGSCVLYYFWKEY
jgi:hypothetical protein